MNRIPRVAYFYWGNTALPYLRYMSMITFKKFNPDWKVICFTPVQLTTTQSWSTFENKESVNTRDYTNELRESGVILSPFDMQSIGFSNDLSEVLKSDLLRLFLLSRFGGLWSDNDILYFRPITKALPTTDCGAYFCFRRGGVTQENTPKNGPRYHLIGFLASEPGNTWYTQLFNGAKDALNTSQYQSVGSTYYKTLLNDGNIDQCTDIFNIDINTVYPSRAYPGMWEQTADCHTYEVLAHTVGWHFYGGGPVSGQMQNLITPETYMKYDNIICWLLNKIVRGQSI